MLKQQQLLLQLELEWQQKYPHMVIPGSHHQFDQQVTRQGPVPEAKTILITNQKLMPVMETVTASPAAPPLPAPSQPGPVAPRSNTSNGSPKCANSLSQANCARVICRLEDLKVSDLKVQLKKRSLPVSGSKPQLLERLKLFADEVLADIQESKGGIASEPVSPSSSSGSSHTNESHKNSVPVSPPETPMDVEAHNCRTDTPMEIADSVEQAPAVMQQQEQPMTTVTSFTPGFIITEDILKFQQKRIEQLQRELENSQQQMHQQQMQQQQFHFQLQQQFFHSQHPQTISIPLSSLATPTQFQVISAPTTNLMLRPTESQKEVSNSGAVNQQTLSSGSSIVVQGSSNNSQQVKASPPQSQNEKSSRRHSHPTTQGNVRESQKSGQRKTSASVKASLAAFLQNQAAAQHNQQSTPTPVKSNKKPSVPPEAGNGPQTGSKQHRANSFSGPAANDPNGQVLPPENSPDFAHIPKIEHVEEVRRPQETLWHLPPNYEEAMRQNNNTINLSNNCNHHQSKSRKKSIKSQAVDDVLEILIKNGELPPSAAQEPPTPTEVAKPNGLIPEHQHLSSNDPLMVKPAKIEFNNQQTDSGSLDLDFALDLQDLAESMEQNSSQPNVLMDPFSVNDWMPQTTPSDPLFDLFFNDSDYKTGQMGVWDRLDFAA